MALNPQLTTDNYILLSQFIDPKWANHMYQDLVRNGQKDEYFNGDDNEMGPIYNLYKPHKGQEMLYHLTSGITGIVEASLFPTYSMMRLYKQGSHLRRHTDRPACEISMTMHLGGDEKWELLIERPDGEVREVILNPGDALLYLGCTAMHSRKGRYQGNDYGQLFLHYVRSQGPLAYTEVDLNTDKPDYDWESQLKKEYTGT